MTGRLIELCHTQGEESSVAPGKLNEHLALWALETGDTPGSGGVTVKFMELCCAQGEERSVARKKLRMSIWPCGP